MTFEHELADMLRRVRRMLGENRLAYRANHGNIDERVEAMKIIAALAQMDRDITDALEQARRARI